MRNWDVIDWALFLIILIIGGAALLIGLCIFDVIIWSQTPIFEKKCHLISSQITPSTEDVDVGAGLSSSGVTPVIVPTGDPEKKITIWECEELGKIVSNVVVDIEKSTKSVIVFWGIKEIK